MRELFTELEHIVGEGQVKEQEPMSSHTTFHVGGPARWFVSPGSAGEIQEVLQLCREREVESFVVGNGSNLLVSDSGYPGVILHLGSRMSGYETEGGRVTVRAGMSLSSLARRLSRSGLAGMTFASGIPGSFGGAVVMNAGAYGGEMSQVLSEVTFLEEDGQVRTLPASELGLGYRASIFKGSRRVVLEGRLELSPGDPAELMERVSELNGLRQAKQPLEYPSAGSTFKRPEGYFAGKLIQDCGLAGYRVGGAQVSEKHCGFLINRDHAAASDVYELIRQVQQKVREQFGVELETEVVLLGKF